MDAAVNPRGVDLSHWNFEPGEIIDWELFKQYYSFVIVKATEGKQVIDSAFEMIWTGAKWANVPRAAYHYFKFRSGSYSRDQAEHFWNVIGDDPGEMEMWGDFEERAAGDYSLASRREWIEKFLKNMSEQSGVDDIGCYTSPGWWDTYIANATNGNTDLPRLMNPSRPRSLWVANWYVGAPKLPYDWRVRYGDHAWVVWQDTNKEDGTPAGIPDMTIDGNWFNGTYAQFNERYGTNISAPSEPPVVIPPPDPGATTVEIAYLASNETLRMRDKAWGDVKAMTWNGERWKVVSTLGANTNPEKYWIQVAGEPGSEGMPGDLWIASWYTKEVT